MSRTIDVRTEMRRLASSKPVHAAAGVGVIASETLRDLQTRIARLRDGGAVASLPARAGEYVVNARTRAAERYDKLAIRGERAMAGRNGTRQGGTGATAT